MLKTTLHIVLAALSAGLAMAAPASGGGSAKSAADNTRSDDAVQAQEDKLRTGRPVTQAEARPDPNAAMKGMAGSLDDKDAAAAEMARQEQEAADKAAKKKAKDADSDPDA